MRKLIFQAGDIGAAAFALVTSPVLKIIGRYHGMFPLMHRVGDRLGFQIRSTHYYEPTYSLSALPADTTAERPLPGLDLNEAGQLALLARFGFADELRAIPDVKAGDTAYGYLNGSFGPGDSEMLYNMIRLKKPARLVEIGSGQSSLMARLAIAANRRDDPAYACEHLCIEPYEAPWLESIGVRVVRDRVETIDRAMFDSLGADDILFIDSSHVIRPWGDVLFELQDIVPRLAPGVIVHVHDVFTPRDYPESWLRDMRRLWNEQYLLESFLAFNNAFEVICANNWLKHNHFDRFTAACPLVAKYPESEPGSFWFRRCL